MTAAERTAMIEDNLPLAYHAANKFSNTGYDLDDLRQIAVVGLIIAVDTFDQSRGCKFSTLAYRCMRNELCMFLRSNKKDKLTLSLQSTKYNRDGDTYTLEDTIIDESASCDEALLKESDTLQLHECFSVLNDKELNVIKYRYACNETQVVTANNLGVTQACVSRTERRAIRKLQRRFFTEQCSG